MSVADHPWAKIVVLTLVALHPFRRNDAGDFWTSATVRDHTIFGYNYPELMNLWDATLIHRVNALYGENATSQFSWDQSPKLKPIPESPSSSATSSAISESTSVRPVEGYVATATEGNVGVASTSPSASCSPYAVKTRRSTQHAQRKDVQYHYFANIRAQKGGPVGAYKVFVFFGPQATPNQDNAGISEWIHDPGFVGFTGFQNAASPDGEVGQGDLLEANSVVALTQALEEKLLMGQLSSLDEDTVAAYLHDNMSWKIVMVRLHQTLPNKQRR